MKITEYIKEWQARRNVNVLRKRNEDLLLCGGMQIEQLPFARVMFYNIADILTDIANEVLWRLSAGDRSLFAGWKAFYEMWGKLVLHRLFEYGFVVIGIKDGFFSILTRDEYNVVSEIDETKIIACDKDTRVYVLKSITYMLYGCSDFQLLRPYLILLDNVLNASNTISARLGSMVILSPQNAPSTPMPSTISKAQREELEQEMSKSYGSLSKQKQVMLLSRPMNTQVLNLAGLDQKTAEKAKIAILAICDRIKVPANQVAFIDANSSRSLANGTELREGDLSKYRSFRRLLNATFWQMAYDIGLQVDYTIENEPKTTQGDNIEQ